MPQHPLESLGKMLGGPDNNTPLHRRLKELQEIIKSGRMPVAVSEKQQHEQFTTALREVGNQLLRNGSSGVNLSSLYELSIQYAQMDRRRAIGQVHFFAQQQGEMNFALQFRGERMGGAKTLYELHAFIRSLDERITGYQMDLYGISEYMREHNLARALLNGRGFDPRVEKHQASPNIVQLLEEALEGMQKQSASLRGGRVKEAVDFRITKSQEILKRIQGYQKQLDSSVKIVEPLWRLVRNITTHEILTQFNKQPDEVAKNLQEAGFSPGDVASLQKQIPIWIQTLEKTISTDVGGVAPRDYGQYSAKIIGQIRVALREGREVTIQGQSVHELAVDRIVSDLLEARALIAYHHMRNTAIVPWYGRFLESIGGEAEAMARRANRNADRFALLTSMSHVGLGNLPLTDSGGHPDMVRYAYSSPALQKQMYAAWFEHAHIFDQYAQALARIVSTGQQPRNPAALGWIGDVWNDQGTGLFQEWAEGAAKWIEATGRGAWLLPDATIDAADWLLSLIGGELPAGEVRQMQETKEKFEKSLKGLRTAQEAYKKFESQHGTSVEGLRTDLRLVAQLHAIAPVNHLHLSDSPRHPLEDKRFAELWKRYEEAVALYEEGVKANMESAALGKLLQNAHKIYTEAWETFISRLGKFYQQVQKPLIEAAAHREDFRKQWEAYQELRSGYQIALMRNATPAELKKLQAGLAEAQRIAWDGYVKGVGGMSKEEINALQLQFAEFNDVQRYLAGAYLFLLHQIRIRRIPAITGAVQNLSDNLGGITVHPELERKIANFYTDPLNFVLGVGITCGELWLIGRGLRAIANRGTGAVGAGISRLANGLAAPVDFAVGGTGRLLRGAGRLGRNIAVIRPDVNRLLAELGMTNNVTVASFQKVLAAIPGSRQPEVLERLIRTGNLSTSQRQLINLALDGNHQMINLVRANEALRILGIPALTAQQQSLEILSVLRVVPRGQDYIQLVNILLENRALSPSQRMFFNALIYEGNATMALPARTALGSQILQPILGSANIAPTTLRTVIETAHALEQQALTTAYSTLRMQYDALSSAAGNPAAINAAQRAIRVTEREITRIMGIKQRFIINALGTEARLSPSLARQCANALVRSGVCGLERAAANANGLGLLVQEAPRAATPAIRAVAAGTPPGFINSSTAAAGSGWVRQGGRWVKNSLGQGMGIALRGMGGALMIWEGTQLANNLNVIAERIAARDRIREELAKLFPGTLYRREEKDGRIRYIHLIRDNSNNIIRDGVALDVTPLFKISDQELDQAIMSAGIKTGTLIAGAVALIITKLIPIIGTLTVAIDEALNKVAKNNRDLSIQQFIRQIDPRLLPLISIEQATNMNTLALQNYIRHMDVVERPPGTPVEEAHEELLNKIAYAAVSKALFRVTPLSLEFIRPDFLSRMHNHERAVRSLLDRHFAQVTVNEAQFEKRINRQIADLPDDEIRMQIAIRRTALSYVRSAMLEEYMEVQHQLEWHARLQPPNRPTSEDLRRAREANMIFTPEHAQALENRRALLGSQYFANGRRIADLFYGNAAVFRERDNAPLEPLRDSFLHVHQRLVKQGTARFYNPGDISPAEWTFTLEGGREHITDHPEAPAVEQEGREILALQGARLVEHDGGTRAYELLGALFTQIQGRWHISIQGSRKWYVIARHTHHADPLVKLICNQLVESQERLAKNPNSMRNFANEITRKGMRVAGSMVSGGVRDAALQAELFGGDGDAPDVYVFPSYLDRAQPSADWVRSEPYDGLIETMADELTPIPPGGSHTPNEIRPQIIQIRRAYTQSNNQTYETVLMTAICAVGNAGNPTDPLAFRNLRHIAATRRVTDPPSIFRLGSAFTPVQSVDPVGQAWQKEASSLLKLRSETQSKSTETLIRELDAKATKEIQEIGKQGELRYERLVKQIQTLRSENPNNPEIPKLISQAEKIKSETDKAQAEIRARLKLETDELRER